MRGRLLPTIVIIQTILLLAHLLLYFTWTGFCGVPAAGPLLALRVSLALLAFTFVAASLLAFYYSGPLLRILYTVAAVWMGCLNYLFFSALLTHLAWWALVLTQLAGNPAIQRPLLGWSCLGLGAATALFGLANARWIRTRRVTVTLAGLPVAWRGRTALLMSDLHLGNVHRAGFARRIVSMAARLKPDVVLIAGDFYDGTRIDEAREAAPFRELKPPFGVFFATGNHDEFGQSAKFQAGLRAAGIRILNNEKDLVDGLQILGVTYEIGRSPIRLKAALDTMNIDRSSASILIHHVPSGLPVAEQAGVSLQVSGHTHGGQFAPFTWITQRIFREFTYGLHRFGKMQVFTSYGAGTWGPPMRVGTAPEIVLLRFQ